MVFRGLSGKADSFFVYKLDEKLNTSKKTAHRSQQVQTKGLPRCMHVSMVLRRILANSEYLPDGGNSDAF